jgi:hypothetical protein
VKVELHFPLGEKKTGERIGDYFDLCTIKYKECAISQLLRLVSLRQELGDTQSMECKSSGCAWDERAKMLLEK